MVDVEVAGHRFVFMDSGNPLTEISRISQSPPRGPQPSDSKIVFGTPRAPSNRSRDQLRPHAACRTGPGLGGQVVWVLYLPARKTRNRRPINSPLPMEPGFALDRFMLMRRPVFGTAGNDVQSLPAQLSRPLDRGGVCGPMSPRCILGDRAHVSTPMGPAAHRAPLSPHGMRDKHHNQSCRHQEGTDNGNG